MPEFVHSQLQYEVIMGSFAYGVSSDVSDLDVYGFCVGPKSSIFPHTSGSYIFGFDNVPDNFEQWQKHHVYNPGNEQMYDFCIYNINKYFKLCANGNPNMIDSLFVPQRCVVNMTELGNRVRENRKLFLSKKVWHTFKGYAYSQMHKMKIKQPEGKRKEMVDKFGYDVKFAYHVIRLLNEVEQILLEGDLDLERNREQLKAIRRGEWEQKQIEEYFETKEKDLESLYLKSELPHRPKWNEIRKLLSECLEIHFADTKLIVDPAEKLFKDLWQDLTVLSMKYQGKVKL
jgi:predicted nucleotidyltransferase